MDELQEQLELGRQAKEFKSYISMTPYFYKLLDRERMKYVGEIISLTPLQTDEFTMNKSALVALEELVNTINFDVSIGDEAEKRLNGEVESGGLL